jgi:hypothetical protein
VNHTYNAEAVDASIAQARRTQRVSKREAQLIHAILKGRSK